MFQNSFIDLGPLEFEVKNSAILGMIFFFKMSYQEPLADDFVLVKRGNNLEDGHLKIILKKVEGGRIIQILVQGDPSKRISEALYNATSVFKENENFYFVAGIVTNP